MENFLNYLFDIFIVITIFACIATGVKKGFIQMLISLIGIIAAFTAAAFISDITSEYIYANAVKPIIMDIIETKSNEISDDYLNEITGILTEQYPFLSQEQINSVINENSKYLNNYADLNDSLLTSEQFHDTLNDMFIEYCLELTEKLAAVLPDEIIRNAEAYINERNFNIQDKLDIFTLDDYGISEVIELYIVRPILIRIVKTVIFSTVFIIVNLIFKIIGKITGIIKSIPAVKDVNRFLGGVLGLFKSLFMLIIFSAICSIFIKLTGDNNRILNSYVISNTFVFKWVYSSFYFLSMHFTEYIYRIH